MVRQSRSKNPFVFAEPLAPGDLVDREEELALLVERRHDGLNTRLASPRDFGKTSLLHRAIADAREDGAGGMLGIVDPVFALWVRQWRHWRFD